MSSNSRIEWIDTTKGLLILLVILGHAHVGIFLDVVINTFHMCGFFFLSGYTFHTDQKFKQFIEKQVQGLLIPYATFSAVFLIVEAAKACVLHVGAFDLKSGIISFFLPVSGRESTSVYTMWFFPCLFLTKLFAYWIERAWCYKRSLGFICCIALLGVCLLFHIYSGVISIISILPFAMLFFACGRKFKIVEKAFPAKALVITSCVLYASSVTVNVLLSGKSFDLSSMTLGFWPLYVLSSVSGTVVLIFFAKRVSSIRLLSQIGIDSRYYYGLHFEVLSLISHTLKINWGIYSLIAAVITVCILYTFCLAGRKLTS